MSISSPSSHTNTDSIRSTHSLIPSDRVEGTPVRRPNGDTIGQIRRLMIDKVSGKVAYAVLSFGGFLGLGERYVPIPWSALSYNLGFAAYELDVSDEQLKGAPSYDTQTDFDWGDRSHEVTLHEYYRTLPYWGI